MRSNIFLILWYRDFFDDNKNVSFIAVYLYSNWKHMFKFWINMHVFIFKDYWDLYIRKRDFYFGRESFFINFLAGIVCSLFNKNLTTFAIVKLV